MLRVAVFSLFMAISLGASALDESSSMPQVHRQVVKTITDELGLSEMDGVVQGKIYATLEYALVDGWFSYWIGNRDLDKARFKDEKVRIIDLIISNNNRVSNISYTYFPAAGQIFFSRKQFVEGSASAAVSMFQKSKTSSEMKKLNETDNYGFMKRDGFLSFEVYHVRAPNGAVTYVDYGLIDLKEIRP